MPLSIEDQLVTVREDFAHVRGDDFAVLLTLSDDEGPADVSGWTFTCQYRADPDDESELGAFSFDLSDAAEGKVIMSADALGEGLSQRYVHYDLEIVTESDFRRTIMIGHIALIRDTTRS